MRVALAQINSSLGDFEGNSNLIIKYIQTAFKKKAELVVFPESVLFGYHPFDLLERSELIVRQEKYLAKIQKSIPEGLAVIFGLLTKRNSVRGRPYHNSAVLMIKGKKPKTFHKQLIPTGDVFDEARFIEPGDMTNNFFTWKRRNFFITICEDIWAWPDKNKKTSYQTNPLLKIQTKKQPSGKRKYDLVINMSASPYFIGKEALRERVTFLTAKHFGCPVLYTNLVGGQDEIIFDGASFVVDQKGEIILRCQKFQEDLNIFNLQTSEAWSPPPQKNDSDELRQALVLGIRDFCRKTGIQKVHLGLSGGIDSAVVACLAVDALGPSRVVAFALPGPFSAVESLNSAVQLANKLNIVLKTVDIQKSYHKFSGELAEKMGIGGFSIVHENLQARIRGLFLMAFANSDQSLLLTTGNKSEYATGYCTLYGDMSGGLAPIGDLTKGQVYKLARRYNKDSVIIPEFIIDRAPSAELKPNQKDQDTLPDYKSLDNSVIQIVEKCQKTKTATDKWLYKKLLASEFKRWQAPPILKISSHSFGRGRRYPIAVKGPKGL